ncbi:hypothetical protein ACFLVX_02295 [Chloroflexota bacterium]
MTTGEIIQLVTVSALVLITGYYAYQTHRQANLLKEQINLNRRVRDELGLQEIISWVEELELALTTHDSENIVENIRSHINHFVRILGKAVVLIGVAIRIDLELAEEVVMVEMALKEFIEHIENTLEPDAALVYIENKVGVKKLDDNPELLDEFIEKENKQLATISEDLWSRIVNVKRITSNLREI